ncbi:MAG TPA: hypothetical protein VMF58_13975 [Rhizomicrobium sp.]|nr:hypothetical protein [Rhizomicrobium sp.]
MRKFPTAARILCSGIFFALAAASSAQAQAWLTFDVNGSTAVHPTAMIAGNTIVGYYLNSGSSTYSAFIRTSDGTVSAFDYYDDGSTKALSANKGGDTAGVVIDSSFNTQAFVRTAGGQFTVFSVNGARFSEATGITDKGWIAGDYTDPSTSKQMGFIRKPNGDITTFASPDGSNLAVLGINNKNSIIGTYGNHGYVRDSQGNMTTFRITANYVVPVAINTSGVIAGYYADTSGKIHGFVRPADGGNPKGFNPPVYTGVLEVTGMNDDSTVVGWSIDAQGLPHGFAVNADFKFATLNAPQGTNGTEIYAIGPDGKLAGYYHDANNDTHAVRANAAVTGF